MSQKPWVSEIADVVKDVGKSTALGLFRIVGIILASGIVGTIAGAGVCLWYGAPLVFALAGGVVGIVVALVVLYALLDAW